MTSIRTLIPGCNDAGSWLSGKLNFVQWYMIFWP